MPRRHIYLALFLLGVSCHALAQPAPAQPPAAPAEVSDADNRDMRKLEAEQKKLSDQFGGLNAVNPLSQDGPGGRPGELPPALKTVSEWLKNPAVAARAQRLVVATRDPEFQKAAMSIAKNPNIKWMYAGLLVYTIFFWLLKRRVLAATDRFLARLMIKGSLFVVFFLGYFLVVYLVLGDPVVKVMLAFKGVVFT